MEVIPYELRENISEIVSSPSFDWNVVPDYLKKYVAVFLRYNDILALCASSKSVREEICEDDFFWEMKTRNDFRTEYDYPPWPRENWEEDYRFYMRLLERNLIRAIKEENPSKVEELIEFGVDVNFTPAGIFQRGARNTPLLLAVLFGKLEIAKLLLENGADVNAKGEEFFRSTALHGAIHKGRIDIVRLLLEYGANATSKNTHGGEPIVLASDNSDSVELVDMLLENGADINSADKNGVTLLLIASILKDDGEYIQALIDRGAEIDVLGSGPRGYTPLIGATTQRNPNNVRVLLENGVDINIRNTRGRTALDIARRRGYPSREIRRMLRRASSSEM